MSGTCTGLIASDGFRNYATAWRGSSTLTLIRSSKPWPIEELKFLNSVFTAQLCAQYRAVTSALSSRLAQMPHRRPRMQFVQVGGTQKFRLCPTESRKYRH